MPRKPKIEDPFERARLKKLRAAQRREDRKRRKAEAGDDGPRRKREAAPDYSKPMVKDDFLWIRRGLVKSYASRMLNSKERPYWLSIPHRIGDGALPVANFYPCTMFRTKKRAYYGFMFREHREMFFDQVEAGRKELTCTIRALNPNVL